jgi:hypothetical protein
VLESLLDRLSPSLRKLNLAFTVPSPGPLQAVQLLAAHPRVASPHLVGLRELDVGSFDLGDGPAARAVRARCPGPAPYGLTATSWRQDE